VDRLTTESSEDVVPEFSHDGRWIYFGSNRNGSWQLRKMPSDGGQATRFFRRARLSSDISWHTGLRISFLAFVEK
jgi:Tol biopolymer transport system component